MKYRIQTTLYHLTIALEVIVGAFLLLGVIFAIIGLAGSTNFTWMLHAPASITSYLNLIGTIVLSIEFTKMLCTHSLDSVIEVLSMAIAREIIAHETTAVENLLGVIAIAILFVVRKFCFVPQLDKTERAKRSLARETLHDFLRRSESGASTERKAAEE